MHRPGVEPGSYDIPREMGIVHTNHCTSGARLMEDGVVVTEDEGKKSPGRLLFDHIPGRSNKAGVFAARQRL